MTIGDRIKIARKAKKLTQEKLASLVRLKQNTVACYEIGSITPSERSIADIARVLDVDEVWLVTGDGEMQRHKSRDEEIAAFVGGILKGDDPSFQRRLIAVMARMSLQEWKTLEHVANMLLDEMQERGDS